MKRSLFLIVLLASLSCTTRSSTPGDVTQPSSSVKVNVTAIPRQGFVPLRVSFHATLQGVDASNKDFYCLKEQWDFGDGAISTEQPHCETFQEGSEITTAFFVEHVYEKPGSYGAFFSLGEEKGEQKNVVRSSKVQVTAIESMRGYSEQ
jgi:PKD repeat protein